MFNRNKLLTGIMAVVLGICIAVTPLMAVQWIIQPDSSTAEDCQTAYLVKGLGTTASWPNYNNGKVECFAPGAYDYNTQTRGLLRFSMPSDIDPDSVISATITLSLWEWSRTAVSPANIR
jgi:hypothetical protein